MTTQEKIQQMLDWLAEGNPDEVIFIMDEYRDEDSRNVTALLNGAHGMLEAAQRQIRIAAELTGPTDQIIGREYAVEAIIEPLWQAFKEARDEA